MKYDNERVRRRGRLLEEEKAIALLHNGEYGILSMHAEGGEPYGVPVNYAWDGDSAIYIHCASVGRKLCYIAECSSISFCVVGKTKVISNQFSTEYESIILSGNAHTGLNADERMHALMLILKKYSPNDMELGMRYAEKSFSRTEIIRLDIREWSGKSKQINE